jgi:hypothetical protein
MSRVLVNFRIELAQRNWRAGLPEALGFHLDAASNSVEGLAGILQPGPNTLADHTAKPPG